MATTAPRLRADLRLEGNTLTGTVENASDERLESAAVVLGGAVAALGDLDPGQKKDVRLALAANPFRAGVPDQVIGTSFDSTSDAGIRRQVRYNMISQLTYDPNGTFTGQLPSEAAVILAFGQRSQLEVSVSGVQPRWQANVMYYVPVGITVRGEVTLEGDLIRSTVVEADGMFFGKDRAFFNMDRGSATVAFQPIPFDGTIRASQLRFGLTQGGGTLPPGGKPIEPLPSIPEACTDLAGTIPEGCQPARQDFLPEVELFDRTGDGNWVRLPQMGAEAAYNVADPARYVDPATGQVLIRFVNENLQGGASFGFNLSLTGVVQ